MSSGTQPSKSGIVTDANGQRHIPSSTRADGTTRREIKIRPGYRPPEDVEVYRNRTAEAFRSRGKGADVPGAEPIDSEDKPGSVASNKNAKRREAKRKAKAAAAAEEDGKEAAEERTEDPENAAASTENATQGDGAVEKLQEAAASLSIDPEAEKEKKVKRLKKKLREAKELQQKKDRGEGLLPEQLQKALRINEIIRELEQLGYNADGDPIAG